MFENLTHLSNLERLELALGVCKDKDCDLSSIRRAVKAGHTSILEHASMLVETDCPLPYMNQVRRGLYECNFRVLYNYLKDQPYSFVGLEELHDILGWEKIALKSSLFTFHDDNSYRIFAECETDVDLSHQLVRHRALSFTQQSSRSVEPRLLLPAGLTKFSNWLLRKAVWAAYYQLLRAESRDVAKKVLPKCHSTTLYVSGTADMFASYIKLRQGKGAQKDHKELSDSLKQFDTLEKFFSS